MTLHQLKSVKGPLAQTRAAGESQTLLSLHYTGFSLKVGVNAVRSELNLTMCDCLMNYMPTCLRQL